MFGKYLSVKTLISFEVEEHFSEGLIKAVFPGKYILLKALKDTIRIIIWTKSKHNQRFKLFLMMKEKIRGINILRHIHDLRLLFINVIFLIKRISERLSNSDFPRSIKGIFVSPSYFHLKAL